VISNRVASFFELAYKETPHAMATKLEGYCISGVEGVARNYIQETVEMKSTLVKIIQEKLHEYTLNVDCEIKRLTFV
jgi:hypothetical protein